ncbi:MAG: MFS transporter [Actinomycetota bacterium]|nr:MFS transporter [Actinomycetota bacterium]
MGPSPTEPLSGEHAIVSGPAPGTTGYPATAEHEIIVKGYRGVFAIPGTRRLLISALIGRLPIGASSLAILLLVREQTGSFGVAGLAVGVFAIAGAIAAPFQGALLDRFGPRRVLIPLACSQATALIALVSVVAIDVGTVGILAVAGVAGALVPPISATVRVLWPRIIPTTQGVETAYALDATTQELIWTSGPLLVALMIGLASPSAALLLVVGVLLAGTALFITAPAIDSWPEDGPRRTRGGALASRPLRLLLVTAALIGMGLGSLEVGLPALSVSVHSASMAGVLLAAWSIGSLLGGILYGARSWTSPVAVRYAALLFAGCLAIVPLLFAGSLGVAIGLAVIAGLPGAAMLSGQYVLVGRAAPPGALAEAFTWSLSGLITGIAAGSALAGQLVDANGAEKAFLLGAVATGLAGLLALRPALRARTEPAEPSVQS